MKSTGIVRKIDDLGRIVLPAELRRLLKLGKRAEVEIYTDNDAIVLKRHGQSCIFCGAQQDLLEHEGYCVCRDCVETLTRAGRQGADTGHSEGSTW